MPDPLTHASFFTGAGGLDIGLERAGWRTVSTSEIDRYACALLEQRFPDAPNLGDITTIKPEDIPDATLWTGGFPCQDLSKAGKRRGFGGDRSVLAFTFLDLVERRRPRWIILENVDGLLSSNDGRDFARLVGEVDGLGYGLAWRVLDAQWFGVAQRRRRVFLVCSRDSDRAGPVLFESEGGVGDPPAGVASRAGAAGSAVRSSDGGRGPDIIGPLTVGGHVGIQPNGQDAWTGQLVVRRPPPDPGGVREADGLAGRLDGGQGLATPHIVGGIDLRQATRTDGRTGDGTPGDGITDGELAGTLTESGMQTVALADIAGTLQAPRTGGYRFDADGVETHLIVASLGSDGPNAASDDLAPSLRVGPQSVDAGGPGDAVPVIAFRKATKPQSEDDPERWEPTEATDTLTPMTIDATAILGSHHAEHPLLPPGLDGHRYRLTGNGVVAPVAEWIGRRLAAEVLA